MHLANRSLVTAVTAVWSTVALCAALTGCAPQSEEKTKASGQAGAETGACAPGGLATEVEGKLTVGTDKPAYAPWFSDDEPSNGKGFESAVAYAVAKQLGYGRDAVVWQHTPFNSAFAPGAKKFDFDINQVSISESRKKAVAFSSGYYDVRQAVVALKSSKAAGAKSVADLKKVKLGAQVGTTSLDFINDLVKPDTKPAVYQRNDFAKSALKTGQVDAIVVDLPTAFYITGAEVPEAEVVGQFPNSTEKPEQFGLVLDKESTLTSCVSGAVDALRKDGTLAALEKEWLSDAVDAPVLK
ncbi:ABC transporter substrate-binding protein [Streptomyces microflavus]|uniref:ABC transporter substrate-binding protein n=1 Tax=Streptomyces microflavus TaxID=1919 RepID=UPI00224F532C|nr:ABC transporter substrate-binding protein [Streptomyces microflavus]MCX4650480.1 ABC transporter substrate-binding protein [Streptomyces microflavus]